MKKYKCKICGYVYDPSRGDARYGIPAHTSFTHLPEHWVCPTCGAERAEFSITSTDGDLPKALSDAERAALRELESHVTDDIVRHTDGKRGQRIQKPDLSKVTQEAALGQAMNLSASMGTGHGGRYGSPFEQHPLLGQKQSSAPPDLTSVVQDNSHAEDNANRRPEEECSLQLAARLQQKLGLGNRFTPPTPSILGGR